MRSRVPLVCASAIGAVSFGKLLCTKLPAVKWERKHRDGTSVSLFGGLETSLGVFGTTAALGNTPIGQASFTISFMGGLAGWIDDHLEARFPAVGKGLKGHLGALREGKITSGMLKIILIGTGAAASALILQTAAKSDAQPGKGNNLALRFFPLMLDAGLDTVIVAGTANLLNLLDLRPGRALKSGIILSIPALFSSDQLQKALSLGLITTSICELPADLDGTKMLGDLGANSYGGAIGLLLAALTDTKRFAKVALVAAILALTLASEKVSFSQVIENNPILRELDQLGR